MGNMCCNDAVTGNKGQVVVPVQVDCFRDRPVSDQEAACVAGALFPEAQKRERDRDNTALCDLDPGSGVQGASDSAVFSGQGRDESAVYLEGPLHLGREIESAPKPCSCTFARPAGGFFYVTFAAHLDLGFTLSSTTPLLVTTVCGQAVELGVRPGMTLRKVNGVPVLGLSGPEVASVLLYAHGATPYI